MDTMEWPIELTNAKDYEIHLRRLPKKDFVSIINDLRIKSVNKCCMNIPLCRMQPMPMVCPIMDVDVDLLYNEFINEYRGGDHV